MKYLLAFFFAGILCAQSRTPLTDQRIIDLTKAGVSPDEMVRVIRTAPDVNFDLTPAAEQAMMQAGVSEQTIKAMAQREQHGPAEAGSEPQNRQTLSGRP